MSNEIEEFKPKVSISEEEVRYHKGHMDIILKFREPANEAQEKINDMMK
jgi:hypothetical protein